MTAGESMSLVFFWSLCAQMPLLPLVWRRVADRACVCPGASPSRIEVDDVSAGAHACLYVRAPVRPPSLRLIGTISLFRVLLLRCPCLWTATPLPLMLLIFLLLLVLAARITPIIRDQHPASDVPPHIHRHRRLATFSPLHGRN